MIEKYEDIYKKDETRFLKLHTEYQQRGLDGREGGKVKATDWAVQNGVEKEGTTGTKIRNSRMIGSILVHKDGLKQPRSYWAGFWEPL